MCGIFGYIGKETSLALLIEGLSRLEYRGYDSCGLTAIRGGKFFLKKQQGKIYQLKSNVKGCLQESFRACILHTRWATHGRPSRANAHPHLDCNKQIAIVHNGIIENYLVLKERLCKEGHRFLSDTDTEVIVHLIEKFYKGNLEEAVCKAIKHLKGAFALGVISFREPDKLIGVRKGSPLIVGKGVQGNFIASDVPAILSFTRRVMYLRDEEIAVVRRDRIDVLNFKGEAIKHETEEVRVKQQDVEKGGYEHFMLKEIFEQPHILEKMLSLYCRETGIVLPQLNFTENFSKKIKKIYITACGTAYHAGLVGKYFLEKYCYINSEIDVSSEFRYRKMHLTKDDLLIAISQSGETADTLAAVREAKKQGAKILSVCNVLGSSLVKESQGLLYTFAGPEIGVASTKAYTAQILSLYLFALLLGTQKGVLRDRASREAVKELKAIPAYQRDVLEKASQVKRIAKRFSKFGCFLFLGRGINYPSALEGALKLKEISYIPAEGYPGGEMKHGPIALIDEYRGVVCIAPKDNLHEKMVSNMP
ncbi:MAG: glutamine--fructose-6-phosphate transaminase (isomerizing) [Candidatus Omnitrophota bacterium]|nr:MAG: glutamine--fructose-6-phosphate transaminase (isomerizing) [Candidatus Omnitrophota bacterium]